MNPLLTFSASRLAHMLRQKEVTSEELVEVHINRIRRVNPTLNAVVKDRFPQARAEAREADKKLKSASARRGLPPFHGVPCTVKESFGFTGMPNTSGLVARKGILAEKDSTAVERLRRAGAIPMGVTNVSELCMWMESANRVYGRTNNPYDPRRIAGGSSGGEGSIIGSGASPFGLGSDIGGSIRMPAFFNGVFGHKPTGGLVPNSGQYPEPHGDLWRYCTTGPLARRAEDLMPLLRIMAGPDGHDPGCQAIPLGDPAGVEISDLTVLDVEENGMTEVSGELRAAQRRCAEVLASRGARVEKARIEGLQHSLQIWSAIVSAAHGPSFSELLGEGTPINAFWHLALWLAGRSPHTLPAIGLAILEKIPKLLGQQAGKYVEEGRRLREDLVRRIGPKGVMLFPSYPTVAPLHNKPLLPPWLWAYTAILNVMELPSTQVPLGLDGKGIPLGVQVVGIHGNDHLTIAVAMELERAFGGWVPPPAVA